MEKKRESYRLVDIQAAFADPRTLNRTFSAKQGAKALGMDDAAVVAVIRSLAKADFEKSMTAHHEHTLWQDVYKPKVLDRTLYVKFTYDARRAFLLISFKEA